MDISSPKDPSDPKGPLSEQQFEAMRNAKAARRKIDVAATVAAFNGWSLALFAALSAIVLLFSVSLPGLIVSAGLAAVAYNEFRGKAMLKQLNPKAANLLGWNQIGLGALIVGYCAWSLLAALLGPDPYAELIAQNPELTQTLGSVGEMYRFGAVVIYSIAILLTIPYQAAVAWYYFSRRKHVQAYVTQTPKWIMQIQRSAA